MGFQTYCCPLCAGRHYLEIGGEATAALGVMVGRLNTEHARSVIRTATRSRSLPKFVKARTVKKLAKRLAAQERDDDVARSEPRMLGALIVEHADGKKTRFIAQSGGEDLELKELEGKYYVAKDFIVNQNSLLPRLFGSGSIRFDELTLGEDDFTKSCAAMKVFIAFARALAATRGSGTAQKLASTAAIVKITMAEEVYRPFTQKLPKSWRVWTRGEFDDEQTTHLAVSCHRCKQKIPSMLCPVAATTRAGKLKVYEAARRLVEQWETDYHSKPWGNRKKEYVSSV